MKYLFFVFIIIIFIYTSQTYSSTNSKINNLLEIVVEKNEENNKLLERFIEQSESLERRYDEWGYTCCKVKKGYKFCVACCDKWETASCNIGMDSLTCTCQS